jgi:hypothetical protein
MRAWRVALLLLASCSPEVTASDAAVSDDGAHVVDASFDAGTDADPLAIRDLVVTANPQSVLSCIVTWTTDRPASSIVDFGEGTALAWRVHDETLVTAHRLVVIGMHASEAYRLRARSIAGAEMADAQASFTSGAIPGSIPVVQLDVPAAAGLADTWTLFGIQVLGMVQTTAVMVDRSGRIVWYRIHDQGREPSPVTLVHGGVLLGVGGMSFSAIEVDLEGVETWRGPVSPATRPAGLVHHEYRQLANGHYAILRFTERAGIFGDILEEMAPDGSSVWQWNVFDALTPGTDPDWTHGNALDLDGMPGRALYSAPGLDTIFAIDRATGSIVWRLGHDGSFAPDPDEPDPWFLFEHDPVVLPNGHLLVYDNGRPGIREATRVTEYALDEGAMQSQVVWRYPPAGVSDLWFAQALGGAERLASGHTSITVGSIDTVTANRIFEVTPEGETLWQIQILPLGVAPSRIFRSQQIAPLIDPIP